MFPFLIWFHCVQSQKKWTHATPESKIVHNDNKLKKLIILHVFTVHVILINWMVLEIQCWKLFSNEKKINTKINTYFSFDVNKIHKIIRIYIFFVSWIQVFKTYIKLTSTYTFCEFNWVKLTTFRQVNLRINMND